MEEKIFHKYLDTPIGWLELKSNENALLSISFSEREGKSRQYVPVILSDTAKQICEYFEGSRKVFDLNIAPKGTMFQKQVWKLVQAIDFGETTSYMDIAVKSGSEKNTRAVGLANGKNPIPIIIPCHRIVGSNGKLTGYAGGLEKKRWLLHHELNHSKPKDLLF